MQDQAGYQQQYQQQYPQQVQHYHQEQMMSAQQQQQYVYEQQAQAQAQMQAQAKAAALAKAKAKAKAEAEKDKAEKKKKRKKRFDSKKSRRVGRWYLGETLGKGGYSWVKKGYDRQDGRVVALKFTSKAKGNWSDSQTKQVQNEIEALRQIKHKNVLQLLAYNLNAKYPQKDGTVIPTVLLVLEYLPGGELFDILYYTQALKEDIGRTYFYQLMEGLAACHKAGICHRDIKPQNLLLDSHFALKIADFGLAKVFTKDDDNLMRTFYVGTRGYQAPEILNKDPYSVECDIFSCGVVLFILLSGYPPFEAASNKCRWYAPLVEGNARQFWKQHRGCGIPSAAKDLITRMLWYDKNKRITIDGIKKHKWYNGDKLSKKELIKELKTLHRKMEIERRNDATKQGQLNNSINRPLEEGLNVKTAIIINQEGKQNNDNNNKDSGDSKADEKETEAAATEEQAEEYGNGDTIKECVKILKAVLKSDKANVNIDCTDIIAEKFLNKEKKELFCDNIASALIKVYELEGNTGNSGNSDVESIEWGKVEAAGDVRIEIDYSRTDIECIPAPFEEDNRISFRDIFTRIPARLTLHYIKKIIISLGGTATIDLKECSIDGKLATHNFPQGVIISVRIYRAQEYNCNVVRFNRISGDVLQFQKILRSLIPKCGFVLTGLNDEQYDAIDAKEETQNDENDENEDFLNEFNINSQGQAQAQVQAQ